VRLWLDAEDEYRGRGVGDDDQDEGCGAVGGCQDLSLLGWTRPADDSEVRR
jgi:hypothetical protein